MNSYAWVLPLVPAFGGVFILIALRFFPTPRTTDDGQLELPISAPRRSVIAHEAHKAADRISEEVRRIRGKPPL